VASLNADNIRHLCRAHNQHAAEHVYGTQHIKQTMHRKRDQRQTRPTADAPHADTRPADSSNANITVARAMASEMGARVHASARMDRGARAARRARVDVAGAG
jgi:hypothetical protein